MCAKKTFECLRLDIRVLLVVQVVRDFRLPVCTIVLIESVSGKVNVREQSSMLRLLCCTQ